MVICTKCGAEYIQGSGGWAGICNSCIQKLARPKPRGEAILPAAESKDEAKSQRIAYRQIAVRQPITLRDKVRRKLGLD